MINDIANDLLHVSTKLGITETSVDGEGYAAGCVCMEVQQKLVKLRNAEAQRSSKTNLSRVHAPCGGDAPFYHLCRIRCILF